MGSPLDPPSASDPLISAVERFDRAIEALEARLSGAPPAATGGDAAVPDETLRAELAAAHRREAELAEAAQEASSALDEAIRELKSGLQSAEGG